MINTNEEMLQSDLAYSEMVEDILDGIAKQRLREGQRIASEVKLKEQYNISITSIKRGLNVLVERGVLQRRRGSGTFVADTALVNTQPLVRRDTVAILRHWQYWRYHPFFTEQLNGVMAGLAKHGWKSLDIHCGDENTHVSNRDSSYRNLSSGVVKLELQQKPEVAGVISLQGPSDTIKSIADDGWTVISSGPADGVPYVSYDWKVETERLFRIALDSGARNLGVVSSFSEDELQGFCTRAMRALAIPESDVDLIHFSSAKARQSTELISQGYKLIKSAFRKTSNIDGLVITGDFEAMGVTDALSQVPYKKWQGMPIVSLLNKESKLQARIPMTALVSDGYANGVAMADLLHEHLSNGGNCVDSIMMNCSQLEWK